MSTVASPAVAPKVSSDQIPWNKHTHQKRTVSDWIVDIVIALLVIAIVAVVVYPLWFIIVASFSDQTLVSNGEVTIWPKGFNVAGYERVFQDTRIWTGYRNTILYTVVGTALNLVVTLPAAFALARIEFKPRRVILFLFTFTMYFAGGIVPNYLLYKDLGLLDNWLVFILPGAVSVWNLIIARSFFESSIPEELHDAAQIDGLSYFGYFMKIVIPLSSAIIAVIGLYYFVGHWNDYFTGLIYIRESGLQPLQNVLRDILLANQTNQLGSGAGSGQDAIMKQQIADQIKYGVIIVSTLPLLVIYPFLQKYFNKGVMIGAVKG
ncbi:carbohydrate ABC transporter permease [Bifidobacterium saeculare]|uniref:carbohydrate ABC transporter permease n=1 Tax=Bifidobacterium pullorum TaxID=78448 RepID=UPI0018738C84|nr:carbohydrate ABC transporter permease [Bifidobacterium pullorum]MBE5064599.1 carbohydrate ABC transporter permease [Bifidobacterium pullorum subsp. saeculare]